MKTIVLLAAMLACPAAALAADDEAPRIVVSGTAIATTPPDLATIDYRVVGEGGTSDSAVSAMVAQRARIAGALAALDPRLQPQSGEVSVTEVRGPDCRQQYGQPQLSTGACAITGYVATLQMTIRTRAVKQAGTAVGLIGRYEGRDARLSGFRIADEGAAQRRAIAAALTDAKAKAEAVAQGSGVRLGRIMSVMTTGYGGVQSRDVIAAAPPMVQVPVPPPPPPPPPPIAVDLTPRPIETQGQVTVVYAIAP
jgi:hypothetical protein